MADVNRATARAVWAEAHEIRAGDASESDLGRDESALLGGLTLSNASLAGSASARTRLADVFPTCESASSRLALLRLSNVESAQFLVLVPA